MAGESRGEHKAFDVIIYGSGWIVPQGLAGEDIDAWVRAPFAGAPLFARLFGPLGGIDTRCVWVVDEGPASHALVRALRSSRRFGANVSLASVGYFSAPTSVPTLTVPASGISVDDLVAIVSSGVRAGKGSITVLPMCSACRGICEVAMLLPPGVSLSHLPTVDRSLGHVCNWIDHESRPLALLEPTTLTLVNTPSHLIERARCAILDYRTARVGQLRGTLLVGEGVEISEGAVLSGAIAIGANSVIASGAVLCNGAVIGECCYIREGTMVADAVVLDGAHVRAGDHLVSTVVGRRVRLDAGETRSLQLCGASCTDERTTGRPGGVVVAATPTR